VRQALKDLFRREGDLVVCGEAEDLKGALAAVADNKPDLVIVDLNAERVVDHADLGSFSDYTIYQGWRLRGWPVLTVVRGTIVMQDGKVVGPPGHGRYLARA